MHILITGGSGFIGSRLALASSQNGYQTTVYAQENNAIEKNNIDMLRGNGIDVVIGSVTDRERVEAAMNGVDLVYHLAAAQHEANVGDDHFFKVNVEGTKTVIEAAIASGVKRIVHGSTIGVFGKLDGVIDEDAACHPENIYGKTKYEGETLALSFCPKIEIVVIRIPETYGPGDRRLLKLFKGIQKRMFFIIGSGQNMHQLIYINDLIEALFLAGTHSQAAGEVILVTGRESQTTEQMVQNVSDALNVKSHNFRIPLFPFLIAASVLEGVCRPLGIQPPLHRRRLDFFRKSYRFKNSRAKSVLGFSPHYTFVQGVNETAAWYAQEGLISPIKTVEDEEAHHRKVAQTDFSQLKRRQYELTAQIEPFDSFWEAPTDIAKGFETYGKFYQRNYLKYLNIDNNKRILTISCGYGYLIHLLQNAGCHDALGIDADPEKIEIAQARQLNCKNAYAFDLLSDNSESFDLIFVEQELNHLTKEEISKFLKLCIENLSDGGILVVHSLNGANPITGSEALAQNADHYNTFTEYSLRQVLYRAGFEKVRVIPLNLYIFYENPLNYIGMIIDRIVNFTFRLAFIFYGKHNKLFSKKIAAIAEKKTSMARIKND